MGIIKPSFDTNRQVLGNILPLSTPFTVIIDSSEVCNFRCRYCFRSDNDKSKWGYAARSDFMDWDVFVKTVDQMKEFPEQIKLISLSNHGEPLCNPRLTEMIRYIKKEKVEGKISLHTNASLLTEEKALDLADSDPGKVVISLQGMTSETYKETCGIKIDFEKLVHNIGVFYHKKKSTQLCIKVMNTSLKNEAEELEFYKIFQPIADRVYVEQEVKIWKNVDVDKYDNELAFNKYGNGFKYQKVCPLIFHTIVVAANGDVYPCTQLLGFNPIGNINETSLYQIWMSDKRKSMLLAQLEHSEKISECIGCEIKQNSIFSQDDMIDEYANEIKDRLIR